jgi:hypothetical protein
MSHSDPSPEHGEAQQQPKSLELKRRARNWIVDAFISFCCVVVAGVVVDHFVVDKKFLDHASQFQEYLYNSVNALNPLNIVTYIEDAQNFLLFHLDSWFRYLLPTPLAEIIWWVIVLPLWAVVIGGSWFILPITILFEGKVFELVLVLIVFAPSAVLLTYASFFHPDSWFRHLLANKAVIFIGDTIFLLILSLWGFGIGTTILLPIMNFFKWNTVPNLVLFGFAASPVVLIYYLRYRYGSFFRLGLRHFLGIRVNYDPDEHNSFLFSMLLAIAASSLIYWFVQWAMIGTLLAFGRLISWAGTWAPPSVIGSYVYWCLAKSTEHSITERLIHLVRRVGTRR